MPTKDRYSKGKQVKITKAAQGCTTIKSFFEKEKYVNYFYYFLLLSCCMYVCISFFLCWLPKITHPFLTKDSGFGFFSSKSSRL